MQLDEFLASLGLTFDSLTSDERDSYKQMYEALTGKALTVEMIHDAITKERVNVSYQLCDTKITDKDDQQLKARLKDLMFIEGILLGPLEAKKSYERMIEARMKRNH